MEAARSLGMPYPLAMRRIVLPQAFRQSIPPLGNQFIIGLKDSSLVAYVGLSELWGSGLSIAAGNFQQLDTYIIVGLYYLVLVLLFTYLVNLLEKRLQRKETNSIQTAKRKQKKFLFEQTNRLRTISLTCFISSPYFYSNNIFLCIRNSLYFYSLPLYTS